jgi:ABC-2 type transport system ATP-binding protein
VLRHLTAAGVRSLVCRPPTLEELFLRHYSADPGADEPGERAAVAGGGRQ